MELIVPKLAKQYGVTEQLKADNQMEWVRQEYHDRIRRIARVIGGDDVTLFSYIDNVLAEHFATHKEVIAALYDEHNRPIF